MSKTGEIPQKDYQPNQVVFIVESKDNYKPAKIKLKSSYGTYLVNIYGNKDVSYVAQYTIVPYTNQLSEQVSQKMKKNKKMMKYLKSAEKDHADFIKKVPMENKVLKLCKQQQQWLDQDGNNNQVQKQKVFTSKYEAILNLKVEKLIQDYHDSKQTTFSCTKNDKQKLFTQSSRQLLILKLQWALEDIQFDITNEGLITDIMESQIIEPKQYVITPLFSKLEQAMQHLKKMKKIKFRNYLMHRHGMIVQGMETYFANYSVFLRARQNFRKFLAGEGKSEKRNDSNDSISMTN